MIINCYEIVVYLFQSYSSQYKFSITASAKVVVKCCPKTVTKQNYHEFTTNVYSELGQHVTKWRRHIVVRVFVSRPFGVLSPLLRQLPRKHPKDCLKYHEPLSLLPFSQYVNHSFTVVHACEPASMPFPPHKLMLISPHACTWVDNQQRSKKNIFS